MGSKTIRIALTPAALEAIAATLSRGSVGCEAEAARASG
jgi:hypothetical protein